MRRFRNARFVRILRVYDRENLSATPCNAAVCADNGRRDARMVRKDIRDVRSQPDGQHNLAVFRYDTVTGSDRRYRPRIIRSKFFKRVGQLYSLRPRFACVAAKTAKRPFVVFKPDKYEFFIVRRRHHRVVHGILSCAGGDIRFYRPCFTAVGRSFHPDF